MDGEYKFVNVSKIYPKKPLNSADKQYLLSLGYKDCGEYWELKTVLFTTRNKNNKTRGLEWTI